VGYGYQEREVLMQLNLCVGIDRQLHSNRPALPDVPAIYFISPTQQNIRRVAEVSSSPASTERLARFC
jgi:hypothetical protein